jgi:hypothetical protein
MTQHPLNGTLTSNYIEVKQEINIKIGDSTQKATSTYALFIKRETTKKYDLEVSRSRFKVNDQEVKNKFSAIGLDYFESIFPLQFSIDDTKLVLANAEEISQRIAKKDQRLMDETDGDGFAQLREQFIQKTNTTQKLETFIASLGLVRVLELSLHRYATTDIDKIAWTVPIVGAAFWKIKKLDNPQDNSIAYIESAIDQAQLIMAMEQYQNLQGLKVVTKIAESEIFATFKHEIKYLKDLLTVARSQTNISLQVGTYFEYQEALTLASTID